ncbi:MAG: acetyl-CoA carboxylase biotin carboxyl carrier protein [Planctomycetes bacterium]|nr:acetyl-CoA carboxylase biotin carboxyl carrier protein [Planctomycetota bacterium]
MKLDDIKKLIDVMNEHHLVEIAYEEEGKKIHLRRAELSGHLPEAGHPHGTDAEPVVTVHPVDDKKPVSDENLIYVKSPMVGTFYSAPKPGVEPYVAIGDPVHPDTTVCIIEAMKTMNELKAECEGVIAEIKVKHRNGCSLFRGRPRCKLLAV